MKRNNSSYCCDKIEELIKSYEYKMKNLDEYGLTLEAKISVRSQLEQVINDLRNILYE